MLLNNLCSLVIVLFISSIAFAEELFQAPAVIQIASTVSDGKYSLEEIVQTARINGIKIVILGERDFMRWEYGLWPLRGLIKKTVKSNSLSAYGNRKVSAGNGKTAKGKPGYADYSGSGVRAVLLLGRQSFQEKSQDQELA